MPVNRWLEYLNKMQVRYSHSIHPRALTALETADAERMPPHEFAKTVVYHSGGGFGIAVVPADELVDMVKLRHYLSLPSIRLADEKELSELFPDCELGAMPPFGYSCELPVVVDARIATDFIAFTIGTHRDVVRMSFTVFARLARPKISLIGVRPEVLV